MSDFIQNIQSNVRKELNEAVITISTIPMLKPTLWEFNIGAFNDEEVKFLVKSVDFPSLPTFETIKRDTGGNPFIGFELPDTLTVEYAETERLKIFNHHLEWLDFFFDRRQKVFKSDLPNTPYRFADLVLEKDMLSLETFSSSVGRRRIGSFRFTNLMMTNLDNLNFSYDNTEDFPLSYTYTFGDIKFDMG